MSKQDKAEFKEVLRDELDLLQQLRPGGISNTADSVYERAREANLAGLAFSGGGIRSATFNLGVIQALSRYGLLSKFDYLSTVSGGGYIGGWLSALLHRNAAENGTVDQRAVENFQSHLRPHPDKSGLEPTVGFAPVEHIAVRYLRSYSNYISPRRGMSGDMLAAVAMFLRNFTLIQLALVSLVASILLLAHVVAAGSVVFTYDAPWYFLWLQRIGDFVGLGWPFVGVGLALIVAASSAGWLVAERGSHPTKPASASRAVNWGVILPCVLAAWWFCAAMVTRSDELVDGQFGVAAQVSLWMMAGIGGYGIAWGLGYVAAQSKRRHAKIKAGDGSDGGSLHVWGPLVVAAAFSGALLGLSMFAAVYYVKEISSVMPIELWHAVAFGPPLFLLGLSFVVTVHILAARHAFAEHEREWFSRLGGFVLLYSVVWALLFTLVLFAAPLVQWLAGGGLVALVTWAVGSGLGAWIGRGPSTGSATGGFQWKEIVARIAPWLFLAGLAVIVAHATHITLLNVLTEEGYVRSPDTDFGIAAKNTLERLGKLPPEKTFYAFLGTGLLFLVIAWRFDINLFSLHSLYCNRLTRAYLGASRAGNRKPNPFTGFDTADDLPFAQLKCQRPIPIINTAINMTGGDDLAWQTRRAASFAFTPLWAGFETRSSQGVTIGAYRPSDRYAGGRPLGTLLAVSGAAASPNMGYHTSAAVAALMTAFNLRLGRWCGNPDGKSGRQNIWKAISPMFAAKPLFAELTGSATAQADWINLTDGGHFDNLGVYELIRRRCRLIVVADVGCDPKYKFEDLANLLRKCWTDLGVNIRFEDFEPMHPRQHSRYCLAHGAVGRIEYRDGGPDGAIIYLKSSLTGDEWPDIRQYADAHEDFPHETTADQFFDENQFESYRHLGYKVVAKVAITLKELLDREPKDVPIADIAARLAPPKPRQAGTA